MEETLTVAGARAPLQDSQAMPPSLMSKPANAMDIEELDDDLPQRSTLRLIAIFSALAVRIINICEPLNG